MTCTFRLFAICYFDWNLFTLFWHIPMAKVTVCTLRLQIVVEWQNKYTCNDVGQWQVHAKAWLPPDVNCIWFTSSANGSYVRHNSVTAVLWKYVCMNIHSNIFNSPCSEFNSRLGNGPDWWRITTSDMWIGILTKREVVRRFSVSVVRFTFDVGPL